MFLKIHKLKNDKIWEDFLEDFSIFYFPDFHRPFLWFICFKIKATVQMSQILEVIPDDLEVIPDDFAKVPEFRTKYQNAELVRSIVWFWSGFGLVLV